MMQGQQKNGTPGTGARKEGTSTAEQIRLLIEWGLVAAE